MISIFIIQNVPIKLLKRKYIVINEKHLQYKMFLLNKKYKIIKKNKGWFTIQNVPIKSAGRTTTT